MLKSFMEYLLEKAEYRADDGESEVVHHSSDTDFSSFHPLSHFGSPAAARARAVSSKNASAEEPKHLYSARLKLGRTVSISDDGEDHKPASILHSLHKAGHISAHHYLGYDDKMRAASDEEGRKKILLDILKKRKIDTIRYKNDVEDAGSTSYIITHPKQVRLLRKSNSPVNVKRGQAKLR